jgi:glutamate synthase (NADPH) small chain
VGAARPRDLDVPGRELGGVHLAMDFLSQQNRRISGDSLGTTSAIDARGKRVLIIGGGDTGSDCAGTCVRQGARSVVQFELLAQPPLERSTETPWPYWPMQLRTSHAHEEGCSREWSVSTTAFSGSSGTVQRVHATRVELRRTDDGATRVDRVRGSDFTMKADLVLLAMGFVGPLRSPLLSQLGIGFDKRGNVASSLEHETSVPGVFVAGDARRGASLIVWAIREGRDAAASIDRYLTARSS